MYVLKIILLINALFGEVQKKNLIKKLNCNVDLQAEDHKKYWEQLNNTLSINAIHKFVVAFLVHKVSKKHSRFGYGCVRL